MPLIKDNTYHPPWWLHSGHFQTIYASQLRFVRHVRYRRERIDTPDGDFLDIDWSETGSERLVILSHGLEGHTQRSYILGMVRAVNQAGWDALAWNFRGCSEESNRLLKFYHSGSSDDLAAVISFARQKKRYSRIDLVGFSMGGNITLKYLGETGSDSPPEIGKAVVFSVPCHLASASAQLARLTNKLYMMRFLKSLHLKVRRKMMQFPGEIDDAGYSNITNFQGFDDRYTAPLHGFEDAEDYWRRCSSIYFLEAIRKPTLFINARNDPFLSPECYPTAIAAKHSALHFASPQYGGHVGFVQLYRQGIYWSEAQALSFLSDRE